MKDFRARASEDDDASCIYSFFVANERAYFFTAYISGSQCARGGRARNSCDDVCV